MAPRHLLADICFLASDLDMRQEPASWDLRGLEATDPPFMDSATSKHTSYRYKQMSDHYVGNYRNLVLAQPFKVCELPSYDAISDRFRKFWATVIYRRASGRLCQQAGVALQFLFAMIRSARQGSFKGTRPLSVEDSPMSSHE